jgi:serine/threonine protein kinase
MVLIQYDKAKIILSNSLYSILNQLDFYKKYNYLKNPFISEIFYAFQDKSSFYLVKKFYPGGDLRYHINRKYISESKSKFLIANIILGLDFLHSKGYIYRNLIPENLILDKKGYLHLNDMTLIREISNINYLVTSGHPGYMAPEIILRQKHGIESDFYSLGVILYEIMFNKLPYKSKSKEEYLNDLVSSHNALIKEDELNFGWSRECADFINRCIQKRAELRIGFGGIEELKSHKWLKDFDWEKLRKKELTSPSIPRGINNYTLRNNKEEKIEFFEENIYNFIEYYETMNYFNGYYYNYNFDINFNKEKENINEEEEEINN